MSDKNMYDVTPYDAHAAQIVADRDAEPLVIADVLKQMGLSGLRIPATELRGKTFTILRAKPFMSSFDASKDAWFCVILLPDDDDTYTTVLGGEAVVDILAAVAKAEYERPLQVTLEWIEGGRYGGYYQFS